MLLGNMQTSLVSREMQMNTDTHTPLAEQMQCSKFIKGNPEGAAWLQRKFTGGDVGPVAHASVKACQYSW